MLKHTQICGLGSALLDISCRVNDTFLQKFAIERGTMRLCTEEQQEELITAVARSHRDFSVGAGGSVSNSMAAFAHLGGKASFICLLGEDRYATYYIEDCQRRGIVMNGATCEGPTGTCVALITPDSERSLRTHLGVSERLSKREIPPKFIRGAEWLLIEGFVLACAEGREAIRAALQLAEGRQRTKVALTLGDPLTAQKFNDELPEIFEKVDMLFGNDSEAQALTGTSSIEAAMRSLKQMVRGAAITLGPKGAWVFAKGQEAKVPAVPCVPVDTTGAGDMFAGAFLHTLRETSSVEEAARMGCVMASKVITQIGARLPWNGGNKDPGSRIVI